MRPPIIYLAGPINGCTDDEAIEWRSGFKARLPDCGFLDPMRRDYRGREDESVKEIVEGDKRDIKDSDVLFAYCWKSSPGTDMEVHFAHTRWHNGCTGELTQPILVVVPEGQRVSPWLRYHSTVVLPTLEDAAVWIEKKYDL